MADHPSNSTAQLNVEPELVRAVSREIGVDLTHQTIRLDDSVTVQIDGYNQSPPIACEAFARIGKMNAGQKRKLGNDILKLLFLERQLKVAVRKIIVLAGEDALASLSGRSWQAAAVREFDIQLFHVPLAAAFRVDLEAAQSRQVMQNVTPPQQDGEQTEEGEPE